MTLQEIDEKLITLRAQRDEIKEALRELTARRDGLAAQEEARRRVELMGDAERAALLQAISDVGSIDSSEGVGTPGQ